MAYIGKSPDGTGVRSRFYYTQTSGGGTSVTGSSDDGTSLAFSDGAYVDVFLNGVLLVAGTDYNTSTANTIAGLAALANGDVVEVVVYDIFTVADTVSSLNGGTFTGAVGFSGGITGDVAFDTNTLVVDAANNRVGISEDSPDTKLHLTDHTANAGPVIRLEGNSQNTAGNLLGGIECFNADSSGDGPNVVSAIKFLAHSAIDHGGQITFSTHDGTEGGEGSAPVERARIDENGNLLIGTVTSSTAHDPGVVITSNVQPGLFINNSTTSSGVSLILLRASHSTADETKFEVTAAGNVKSRTNSYGSFSDERLKEQIADASSQWEDIKAIEVKNFKFISELDDADNPKMIGVVAQQVESVSPALVEDDADGIKTVKYSILYMKAVKALQEAMTRIETLETKVAALEAAE